MRRIIVALGTAALALAMPWHAGAAPAAAAPGTGTATFAISGYGDSSSMYDFSLDGVLPAGQNVPFVGTVAQTSYAPLGAPGGLLGNYHVGDFDIVGTPSVGAQTLSGSCAGNSVEQDPTGGLAAVDVMTLTCTVTNGGVTHHVKVVVTAEGELSSAAHGVSYSFSGTYVAYAITG